MSQLADKIRSLPAKPGVYQYFDVSGRLLYVGKAKSLKARVKSYFTLTPVLSPAPKLSPRIARMIHETVHMDYIVVEHENDALILENSLIKQLKPKYNILLRDDKTYPYIYIDLSETYPAPMITRKVVKGRSIKYFGPFVTGGRDLLDTLYELFPLVQKKGCLKGKKVCLFYQIGRCLGPCEGKVTKEAYHAILTDALNALSHKEKLIKFLAKKMEQLSEEMRYEEAMTIRDRIVSIQKSTLSSPIDLASHDNFDLFCAVHDEMRICVVKMFIRHGKVTSSSHHFVRAHEGFEVDEVYPQALLDFYHIDTPIGAEKIIVADDFAERGDLEQILTERLGKHITIAHPQRGDKLRLCHIAQQNGLELLSHAKRETASAEQIVQALCEWLGLMRIPDRIEIFDNSHFQGDHPVGAMVVWDGQEWDKVSYRHYTLTTRDDYHQMHQMLTRRVEAFAKNPPPDLWVIDGGTTLVKLAKEILESVGVSIDVIGVAKEKYQGRARRAKGGSSDTITTDKEVFTLPMHDKRLTFLQRLRDEAHRFAITFHRNQKVKHDKMVSLLDLSGIGEAKVKKMLGYFGSFEAMRSGTQEEFISLFGPKAGKNVFTILSSNDFFT